MTIEDLTGDKENTNPTMNIYLIERVDNVGYDENAGHIIVAFDEEQVLKMAKENIYCYEKPYVWDKAVIVKLGIYGGEQKKPFCVLSDFRAG